MAAEALRQCDNDESAALEVMLDEVKRSALALALVAQDMAAQLPAAPTATSPSNPGGTDNGAGTSAAAAAVVSPGNDRSAPEGGAAAGPWAGPSSNALEGGNHKHDSDEEMEGDIARTVKKDDALQPYDIEVDEECDIISTFLAMLQSQSHAGAASGTSGSGVH